MTKIRQEGLYCKDKGRVEEFADRVSEYNKEKGFICVEMEASEDESGRWNLILEFASRGYARDFWTDPKYDVRVLV